MAVSEAVRRYYAERIFALSGRDRVPPNFRPLARPPTGMATVEGCRGGGKNLLEVFVVGAEDLLEDVRLACGLCNPAMYACADIVADWARGRPLAQLADLDPLDVGGLDPLWVALGGPGRPDDAREKFQYALHAVRAAVRDHLGWDALPLPAVPEATGRDGAQADEDDDGEAGASR